MNFNIQSDVTRAYLGYDTPFASNAEFSHTSGQLLPMKSLPAERIGSHEKPKTGYSRQAPITHKKSQLRDNGDNCQVQ